MKTSCLAEPEPPDRPDQQVRVSQIVCYADGGEFVAPTGTHAARMLGRFSAVRKAADPALSGPPTAGEVAQLVQAAGVYALAAGWVQRIDGYWLCPSHAGIYLAGDPNRFTVRECRHRHRIRHRD